MTNNEAAKWIQLYIDLAKIDPTTGEEAYLNEDNRNTLEAMEMARDALTCYQLATNLQPCKQDDLIRRSDALNCFHDWIDKHGDVHTPDETAEYRAIEELPSVEQETAKRIVVWKCNSIGGTTHWYQCDKCNEPVDTQDNYCRGCGRRLVNEGTKYI